MTPKSVTQDWVLGLSFMQQSVLMSAIRGPDGLRKDHVAKLLLRFFRRSFLKSAFEGEPINDPCTLGGGSFTGPSISKNELIDGSWANATRRLVKFYLESVDEIPHHFHLHLMHGAEIIGYKHPDLAIRAFWHWTYCSLVNDAHLFPESEESMDKRLGDIEANWRAREVVTAKQP